MTRESAESAGHSLTGSKVLGFLGEDEELGSLELAYKPTLRLSFREKVPRALWQRIFGPKYEERSESICLHPRTLQIVVYERERGIHLDERPQ